MERREANPLLTVLALAMALAFVCAPRVSGQREQSKCRRQCMVKYQECRDAAGADQSECQKTFDDCREECGGTRAKPARDAKADGAAANDNSAEPGANDNSNANGGRPHAGGSGNSPAPPKGNHNQ